MISVDPDDTLTVWVQRGSDKIGFVFHYLTHRQWKKAADDSIATKLHEQVSHNLATLQSHLVEVADAPDGFGLEDLPPSALRSMLAELLVQSTLGSEDLGKSEPPSPSNAEPPASVPPVAAE